MKHTPIQAKGYLHGKLKKKNTPQASNRLNELIDKYATLYNNRKLVGMDIYGRKANEGWREESVTTTPEQKSSKQEIHGDTQAKNKC